VDELREGTDLVKVDMTRKKDRMGNAVWFVLCGMMAVAGPVVATPASAVADWVEALHGAREEVQELTRAISSRIAAGEVRYAASPVMRGGEGAREITLPVRGWRDLYLLVDPVEHQHHDWAAWGDARLTDARGVVTFLDELEFSRVETGWHHLMKNESLHRNPIRIGNNRFDRGLVMHAPSMIHVRLDGRYETFSARVGIDAVAEQHGDVRFLVSNEWIHPRSGETPLLPDMSKRDQELEQALKEQYPEPYALVFGAREFDFRRFLHRQDEDSAAYRDATGGATLRRLAGARMASEAEFTDVAAALALPPADVAGRMRAILGVHARLQERARRATPRFAYVRRADYGLRPAVNAVMWCHRTGRGSEIVVVDPSLPDREGEVIFSTENGFIFDIHPSFDGRKLLMTYKEDVNQPFSIWEIHVDGTGLRRVTEGPFHDVTPLYYPDGRIVFASTRAEQYSMCQDFLAFTLYVSDAGGDDIRRISFDTLSSVSPGLMQDGSIASSRWEYMDKTLWTWQGLWTVQPNGRMLQLLYGNTLLDPDALYAPRQVPDSHEVVYVMTGHYSAPIGDLAIVNRRKGIENPRASRKLTQHTPMGFVSAVGDLWRRTRGMGYTTDYTGYTDPWPFSRDLTLASFMDGPSRARVVLVDHGGFTYPLHHDPAGAAFSPVSLAPRTPANSIPGEVAQEEGQGTFYVQDIYEGLLEQGVERGQVAGLRIWRQVPKKYNTEGSRIHDHYPLIGWGSYYVKELYGTVPVDASGSLKFRAPANVELYFSAVDAAGREIQRMGTVTQITTGETIGCIGCHESREQAPPMDAAALQQWARPAVDPVPPPWAEDHQPGRGYPIDYVAQVQPIWDRNCIECHHPADPQGGIDLSGDKSRLFNMSYESLVVRNGDYNRDFVEYYYLASGPGGTFPALRTGSMVSRLIDMLRREHGGVTLSSDELQTIAIWIDANVPYYGTWEMSRPRTPGGRDPFYTLREGSWRDRSTAPGGHELRMSEWAETLLRIMRELRLPETYDMVNLTRPEFSRLLLRHLSSDAGGWAPPAQARFRDRNDPNYQALLSAIRTGAEELRRYPRADMEGAHTIPQPRDFGRIY